MHSWHYLAEQVLLVLGYSRQLPGCGEDEVFLRCQARRKRTAFPARDRTRPDPCILKALNCRETDRPGRLRSRGLSGDGGVGGCLRLSRIEGFRLPRAVQCTRGSNAQKYRLLAYVERSTREYARSRHPPQGAPE